MNHPGIAQYAPITAVVYEEEPPPPKPRYTQWMIEDGKLADIERAVVRLPTGTERVCIFSAVMLCVHASPAEYYGHSVMGVIAC